VHPGRWTNWPGRMFFTALPTYSTMPAYSWPIGVAPASWSVPRYGHRCRTVAADSADQRSDGMAGPELARWTTSGLSMVKVAVAGCFSAIARSRIPIACWAICRLGRATVVRGG
jgi:hypothetical protein